jgi:hypothetical protein
MKRPQQKPATDRSEFAESLRMGLLLGAAFLMVVLPPVVSPPVVHAPPAIASPQPGRALPQAPGSIPQRIPSRRLADFRGKTASTDVRRMAHWVVQSGDHQKMSFVIVDKKDAKVYVFNPLGKLKSAAPALLGEAVGDDSAPGIGDKPISQVLPQEKTTPAGRFVAEVGMSTRGEDVVWVDYDLAVSMHRVLKVKQRLKSLASPTKADNRMSYGCINLPPQFYEKVLRPTVDKGAVIYVLPETRPLVDVFASFRDVAKPVKVKLAQQ